MDETAAPRDTFLDSLDRCARSEQFINAFYRRFLATSDEVRLKFRYTDFNKQHEMLLRSLRLSAGATAGDTHALAELTERARTHDRWHHNIQPHLYEHWLEALIATAREFDPQWTPHIEASWRRELNFVIAHMMRHYDA